MTRAETAKSKLKSEFGLDYDSSKKLLNSLVTRRKNGQSGLTKGQQDLFDQKNLEANEATLKRIVSLINQITSNSQTAEDKDKEANALADLGFGGIKGAKTKIGRRVSDSEDSFMSKEEYTELSKYIEDIVLRMNEADASVDKFRGNFETSMNVAKKNAEDLESGFSMISEIAAQFGIVFSAAMVVNKLQDMAKAAFDFYKSLDSALNQIYVVSNLSSEAVDSLKSNFINMAKETGMALDDIARSAVLFYQQGLNTDEVLEMTRVTSEFAKVAGIDATDAADKLTAAVNGYCLAATDAINVADKFNKVAAASAADINELSTAFSKAAAQANQAGVSMDNYLAYIATMEEATREAPENLGTSLKTIFSRMQQINSGENTEDDTDINKVETALKTVGVQLRDTTGQLRDLEEIFGELGPKWQSLDRNTQAYLGTIVAGTRQQSRFITLMQNWDRVLELSAESENSAGQQALMHRKAMESLESKTQQLNVAWQEFLASLTNSTELKWLVEMLTKLVNSINSGSKPIKLLAAGFGLLVTKILKMDKVTALLNKGLDKIVKTSAKVTKAYTKLSKAGQKNIKTTLKSNKTLSQQIKAYRKTNKQFRDSQKEIDKLDKAEIKNNKTITVTINGEKRLIQTEEEKARAMAELNKTRNEGLVSMKTTNKSLTEQSMRFAEAGSSVAGFGTALIGIGSLLPGTLGNIVTLVGGVTQLGGAFTAAKGLSIKMGQAMNAAAKKGAKGFQQLAIAIAETGIGAIIEAIAIAITGVVVAAKSLFELFGNQDSKLTDSVENVSSSLQNAVDAQTSYKAAKRTYDNYIKLSNQIVRTEEEQEKLNSSAQELADVLGLEVFEDAYGNLSVNVDDAKDKINEYKEDVKKARKELEKTESEELENWDGTKARTEKFYKKYVKENKGNIKNLMADIDIGLSTDKLKADAKTVESITSELKETIISDLSVSSAQFGYAGNGDTLTEYAADMVDDMNEVLSDGVGQDFMNELYGEVSSLQKGMEDLTTGEIVNKLDNFFETWAEKAGLTAEQMEALKQASQGVILGRGVNNQIDKLQTIIGKYDGSYYEEEIKKAEESRKKFKKESATMGLFGFKQDKAEKHYETLGQRIKILKEERNEGTDVTEDEINKYQKLLTVLEDLAPAASRAFDTLSLFDDLEYGNGKSKSATDILGQLDMTALNNAYKLGDQEGAKELTVQWLRMIENTDDSQLKAAYEKKLNKIMEGLKVTPTYSWGDVFSGLEEASEDLRNMNDIMEEFNKNGGISLDTFGSLCDILDKIDMESLFKTGHRDTYINALDKLNLGFDASNGAITANGDAMSALQDIEEAATKAKIESVITDLQTKKMSLQAELEMVNAEKEATLAAIDFLAAKGNAEVELKEIQKTGEAEYAKQMTTATKQIQLLYQGMANDSAEWAEAAMTNAADVASVMEKISNGDFAGASAYAAIAKTTKGSKWSAYNDANLQALSDNGKTVKANLAKEALQKYYKQLENRSNSVTAKIKGIDGQLALLNKLKDADLSKLGSDLDDSSKKADKYIGKLREIYNIQQKIKGIQNRKDMLDSYMDMSRGSDWATFYKERLKITKDQNSLYKQSIQKRSSDLRAERDQIKKSPVGGVFSYDQYGQIMINWEKYNKLQTQSINGEQTQKELADELYDEYNNLYDEMIDDTKSYIGNLKEVVELLQEQVDTYVEVENKLGEAVHDIYEKMLDEKLKAIDTEIEALDKLEDAYSKANKAASDSRQISNLQTSLKRSMMDTSGASNTKVLDYRDQIRTKLEEMGEDEYTQRLDDIKEALENQKESLQRNFDEYFEDWSQMYDMIENMILYDSDAVTSVLQSTEEYMHASDLERRQMADEWQDNYDKAMAGLEGGKSIWDVYNELMETRGDIGQTDADIVGAIEKGAQTVGTYVSTALQNYAQSLEGAINSAVSSAYAAGAGTRSNYSGSLNSTTRTGNDQKGSGQYIIELDDGYSMCQQKRVTKGSSLTLPSPPKSRPLYIFKGWYVPSLGKTLGAGKSYKPTHSETVTGQWQQNASTGKKNGPTTSFQPLKITTKKDFLSSLSKGGFASGGMSYKTGPAWLDGTPKKPEAVLNPQQTKAFLSLVDEIEKQTNGTGSFNVGNNGSVYIDNILFEVDSMSSTEDGKKAFDAFVQEFKKIGQQQGLYINRKV